MRKYPGWLWLLTAFLTLGLIFYACAAQQEQVPQRSFTTVDLLITLSDMPPHWVIRKSGKVSEADLELATDDSARVSFVADGAPVYKPTQLFIYRYSKRSTAKKIYDDFALSGITPTEWTYQSKAANQAQFACYDYEGREPYPFCRWAARYEEYVVEIFSWLIPNRMSLQDLEHVIRAVDLKMARYLKNLPN
jgi:hypothetical protein